MDALALQRSWDAQQEGYLPDREDRIAAMLDVVEAAAGEAPRVLDLAGGTGSISLRLRRRLPASRALVVDTDPVLLAIAEATFDGDDRVAVVRADLADPGWAGAVPAGPFDAVVTATALHWLAPERVAALYAEVGGLLRAGGVVANADHMPDAGLGDLATRAARVAARRRAAAGALDWDGWWASLAAVPDLALPLAERGAPHADHTRSVESADWHVRALRAAGFAEAGLAWRGHQDALVVGVVS